MEEISFTPADSNSAISVKGKILTGVFKSGSGKPKRYSAFSKFFETGFEILHIGINVPHSVFIQQMKKFYPHVLVLVCQGNVDGIKELIETIKKEEMRSMARIILYGPKVSESVRDEVHADACAENERDLFDMVNEIISETFL